MVLAAILSGSPTPSWAAIATAFASLFTAAGGLLISIRVLIPSLRVLHETHHLVNQVHTDSVNYQNALIRALKKAGLEVPIDQSQPNGGTQDATTDVGSADDVGGDDGGGIHA